MIFFLIALLATAVYKIRVKGIGKYNTEYIDKKSTAAINGVFVMLVLFSHYSQYAKFEAVYDLPYLEFKAHIGQLVVVPFLFHSGYGMMESVKRKGRQYITKLPLRGFTLLLKFDIAVILYLIMNALLGITYPIDKVLLSFIAWEAVGNSNWYIFVIIVLYFLMFESFYPFSGKTDRKNYYTEISLFFILTIVFVYLLIAAGKGSWWYNTAIIFPVGCLYSEFRIGIEKVVMKNDLIYIVIVMVTIGVYALSSNHRNDNLLIYEVWAIAFAMLMVLIRMKVCIGNAVINWLGNHVFSMYILQRIPMITLYKLGILETHKYLSLVAVIVITCLMATAFDYLTNALERVLTAAFTRKREMV